MQKTNEEIHKLIDSFKEAGTQSEGSMSLFEFPLEFLIRHKWELPDGFPERQFIEGCATVLGVEPEDSKYLEAVRQWREAWRPKPVRFLIVAESHVH